MRRRGIHLLSDAPGNTIGGTADGAGNLVSGNGDCGITVSESGNNRILGNRIGTDVSGTLALPNTDGGVCISSSPNSRIGGTAVGAGNLISGNAGHGIFIQLASGVLVAGNLIGTDATGSAALPNDGSGVFVRHAPGTTIEGNVISGNAQNGVFLWLSQTSGTQILGNLIGTDAGGASCSVTGPTTAA